MNRIEPLLFLPDPLVYINALPTCPAPLPTMCAFEDHFLCLSRAINYCHLDSDGTMAPAILTPSRTVFIQKSVDDSSRMDKSTWMDELDSTATWLKSFAAYYADIFPPMYEPYVATVATANQAILHCNCRRH